MGLAPSLNRIYGDAHRWFNIYIDKETYSDMFQNADSMRGGSIAVGAIQEWIAKNAVASPDSCWSVFLSSGNAIMMSHKAAATYNMTVSNRKVIDINNFKAFLIHLYAMSMLWKHFASADQFTAEHHADDLYRKKLNMQEFVLACKSLCDGHDQETQTKKQLKEEFRTIDDNCDGLIGFVQICTQFCKHIETPLEKTEADEVNSNVAAQAQQTISAKASKILGLTDNTPTKVNNVMGEFSRGTKRIFAHLTAAEKSTVAMEQVLRKLDLEDARITKYHTSRLHGEDSGGFSAYSQGSAANTMHSLCSMEQDAKDVPSDRFFLQDEADEKYGRLNDGSRGVNADSKNSDKDYKSDDTGEISSVSQFSLVKK